MDVLSKLTISRDKNDDMFLNLMVDGKASVLITRDEDLLVLNPFQNIPILSPGDFIIWYESKI